MGGHIILAFGDYLGPDTCFWVVEPPNPDNFIVDVSNDLTTWWRVGTGTSTTFFSLAAAELWGTYQYVRITDPNNNTYNPPTAGFDVDAIEIVGLGSAHGCTFASEVMSYTLGPNTGEEFANPWRALGQPGNLGLSLGAGGWCVFGFDGFIFDGPGADLRLCETTGIAEYCSIQLSADRLIWTPPVTLYATQDVDLGGLGFGGSYRYVKIVDPGTDPCCWPNAGYDVDAIAVFNWAPLRIAGYATAVASYVPGPDAAPPYNDPDTALGPPDQVPKEGPSDPPRQVSLGNGGVILLELGPGLFTDGPGFDLKVFEPAGAINVPERFQLWVSADGAHWGNPAGIGKSATSFDLAAAGLTGTYRFIKIEDLGDGATGHPVAGYDVDAVVTYYSPPESCFEWKQRCPAGHVEFDGSCSYDHDGSIVNWHWDFGDGHFDDAGATVQHTYAESDTYQACLTVSDDDGLTDTTCQLVETGVCVSFHLPGPCWHMITTPGDPVCTDPEQIFDALAHHPADDLLNGNLHRYDHEGQKYITYWRWAATEFGPITPGTGYWLYVFEPTLISYPIRPIGGGCGVHHPTTGWYMTGSCVPWDVCIDRCAWWRAGLGPYSFADVLDDWVQDPLVGYSCELGRYTYTGLKETDDDHCLRAFRGYWLYTFEDDVTLEIPSAVVIDFESLPGMSYVAGNVIPEPSRLSDQLLATHGVRFSSGSEYVAVVALGPVHATSGANGMGGSTSEGVLTYSEDFPIQMSFFDPSDPALKAVTDFVSVRGDLWASGGTVTLRAYGVDGELLGSVSESDSAGMSLTICQPGIYRVEFVGCGSVALDDLTYHATTPAASRE